MNKTEDRLLTDAGIAYKSERAKRIEFQDLAYALRELVWSQRLRYPMFFIAGVLTGVLGILYAAQAFTI